jgi:hypothetical protein
MVDAAPRWAALGNEVAIDDLVAHAAIDLQEVRLPAAEPTDAEMRYHNAVLMAEEDAFFADIVGDGVDRAEREAVRVAAELHNEALIQNFGSEQLKLILEKMKKDDRHKDHVTKYMQCLVEMWGEFDRLNKLLGKMATRHNPFSVGFKIDPNANDENTCPHCKMTMSRARDLKKHVPTCESKLIFMDAACFALMILAGTVRVGFSAFFEHFLGSAPFGDWFLTLWLRKVRGGTGHRAQGAMWAHSSQTANLTKINATADQIRDKMRAFVCKHPECIFDNKSYYDGKLRQVRQPFPLQGTREYPSVRWAWLRSSKIAFSSA